jgi:hypothetical protein
VHCGRSDPTIRIVLGLTECVTGSTTGDPELDARLQESRPRPDDLGSCEVLFHPPEPLRSPAAESGTKANLCQRLERDQVATAGKDWSVEINQRAPRANEV